MIKRIDRYLSGEFFKSFAMALLGLTLVLLVQLLQDVSRIETRQSKIHLQLFVLYSIPNLIQLVTPPAMMFGVCFTLAHFTVSRELVAIYSAGVSFYRAILPILIFSALLAPILFLFGNFIVTPANAKAQNELTILKKDTETAKDLIWQRNYRGKEGYYFIYYLNPEKKEISGGFNYLQVNESEPIRMLQANRALYINEDEGWKLFLVREVLFDKGANIKKINLHREIVEKFPEPISFFYRPSRDPTEMNVFELWDEINERKKSNLSAVPYQVQLHAGFAFPFMSFVVAIMGAIAGSMGSHRSSGPLIRSLLLSTATILVYQVTFRLGQSLGNGGIIPPAVAGWAPTLIFMIVALYLVWKNRK